jgi:uncharacterized protein (DUF885 family)
LLLSRSSCEYTKPLTPSLGLSCYCVHGEAAATHEFEERERKAMASSKSSARLQSLLSRDWEWQCADSPEYDTLVGQDRAGDGHGNGRLDDLSLGAFQRRDIYHRELAQELASIDTSQLSAEDALTHRLLLDQVT